MSSPGGHAAQLREALSILNGLNTGGTAIASTLRDVGRGHCMIIVLRVLTFVVGLALAPLGLHAQPAKTYRIGFMVPSSPATTDTWLSAFRKELASLGYMEGKNLTIESRFANGAREKLPALAAELAALKVDVFFAPGEPALLAAKDHGANLPIVTVTCDPLDKLVASLARPGGNATGFTCVSSELAGKRVGLFKSLLPRARRLAVLYNPADNGEPELADVHKAAQSAGLEIAPFPVTSPKDFDAAFKGMTAQHCDGLYILASSFANQHRTALAALATEARLPALYGFREFADAGGLMSYGASFVTGFTRAAHMVDKVLKGSSPADIPVEQPTHFDLVLNAKTAKALGLEFPATLLAQADDVIE
jgi:putative ABC transport system substrate-binding protein